MGCYGIGVTRTMASSIEQNNDQDGIIWPMAIAPFHAIIIPVSNKDAEQMQAARELYHSLTIAGVEALLDDRGERAGVKFKDADLIGIPIRITIGKRTVQEQIAEVKIRRNGQQLDIPLAEMTVRVKHLIDEQINQGL